MKTIIILIAFLLPSILFTQETPQAVTFNGLKLEKADKQPLQSAVLYTDSTGQSYVQLILKVQPDGTFITDDKAGLNGASCIAFKGLTASEIEYISTFINYRAAKHNLEK